MSEELNDAIRKLYEPEKLAVLIKTYKQAIHLIFDNADRGAMHLAKLAKNMEQLLEMREQPLKTGDYGKQLWLCFHLAETLLSIEDKVIDNAHKLNLRSNRDFQELYRQLDGYKEIYEAHKDAIAALPVDAIMSVSKPQETIAAFRDRNKQMAAEACRT